MDEDAHFTFVVPIGQGTSVQGQPIGSILALTPRHPATQLYEEETTTGHTGHEHLRLFSFASNLFFTSKELFSIYLFPSPRLDKEKQRLCHHLFYSADVFQQVG